MHISKNLVAVLALAARGIPATFIALPGEGHDSALNSPTVFEALRSLLQER